MRRLILLCALLVSASAWAACTTYSFTGADGKLHFCTSCCAPDGSNCNVWCS